MTTSTGFQLAPEQRPVDRWPANRSLKIGQPDNRQAPTVHLAQRAGLPLASSFSFNSYQDILCNGELLALEFESGRSTGGNCDGGGVPAGMLCRFEGASQSTFSAQDVERSLLAAAKLADRRPTCRRTAQSGAGRSTFALNGAAKFRVHSRHHSISRLDELAQSSPETNGAVVASDRCTTNSYPSALAKSVAKLTPNEPQVVSGPIKHQTSGVQHQQRQVLRLNNRVESVEGSQNLQSTRQHSEQDVQQWKQPAQIPTATSRAKTNQGPMMSSGTMHSIQSLSMQLNQAKARGSSGDLGIGSDLDESGLQRTGGQNTGSSAGKLGKLVGKKASRVKELVLQNLGKADRTADELFEMYEQNFHKQQAQALRLQKEFKSYVASLKGAQEAGKNLNCCIQQATGDYQSARHDLVCENLSQMEHLNEDLLEKLRGQVMANLNEYLSQFGELREKIAKRKRKLIDFDSSRRIYELQLVAVNKKRLHLQRNQQQPPAAGQSGGARSALRSAFSLGGGGGSGGSGGSRQASCDNLQTATSQLVDEARLLKLREQYNYCKVMYETINGELHEELPMIYEKKMKHLLMSLQNYFSLEAQFHSNAGKLFATAADVIDELPMSVLQAASAAAHLHASHQINRRSSSSLSASALDASVAANAVTDAEEADAKVPVEEAGYRKPTSGGSSGMGSSRGDSSLDSSSSPDEEASSAADSQENRRSPSDDDNNEHGHNHGHDDRDVEDEGAVQSNSSPHLRQPVQLSGPDQSDVELVPESDIVAHGSSEPSPRPSSSLSDNDLADSGPLQSCEQSIQDASIKLEMRQDATEHQVEPVEGEPIEPEHQVAANLNAENPSREDVFLYKVKTSYKYLAEDVDELCFEADEILQVVEFEQSQEQEEGWLMGVREVNGQRGLFPANFTQPI